MTEMEFEATPVLRGDVPRDPGNCVVANYLRETVPWMRNITVGRVTISAYDYRCPHNPLGLKGRCPDCPGRALTWATPLPVAKAIMEFDRTGDAQFPKFRLREDEAIVHRTQDKQRKREASRTYADRIAAGEHVPVRRSRKAMAEARADRRAS